MEYGETFSEAWVPCLPPMLRNFLAPTLYRHTILSPSVSAVPLFVTVNEDGTLTGIDRNIVNKGEANVKSVSYTDLSGRTISQPQHGIYLKTVKFADGSQKTVKYLKR